MSKNAFHIFGDCFIGLFVDYNDVGYSDIQLKLIILRSLSIIVTVVTHKAKPNTQLVLPIETYFQLSFIVEHQHVTVCTSAQPADPSKEQ
jgi:hypothetical protein